MCISYKCFAFVKNVLSFVANKHLFVLVSCARTHTHTRAHAHARARADTFSELVIARRIKQQVMIWKEAYSMIKLLLLDLWRTVPEVHCT